MSSTLDNIYHPNHPAYDHENPERVKPEPEDGYIETMQELNNPNKQHEFFSCPFQRSM